MASTVDSDSSSQSLILKTNSRGHVRMPVEDAHQTTPTELSPLFRGAKLVWEETPKAITPFGGLASFIEFLGRIGFTQQVASAFALLELTRDSLFYGTGLRREPKS